ncbi:MAG: exosortase V [Sphingomonas sp.]|uniref:exosortase V n=1 Tax=Sphingomonas sp. TaxID=28214 RepID=UPI000A702AB9|nr:exosortase V [Sphingomonas sp.]MBN8848686.1 exosortase V [Sphingomonas sp.]
MDAEAGVLSSPGQPRSALRGVVRDHWPLLVGLLLLAVPTIVSLGHQTWSTEAGAHGPIVLATGLWLLSHNRIDLTAGRRQHGLALLAPLILALPLYAFGRAYDFISLEVGALYLVFLVALAQMAGVAELRRNLFPLFYLAFVIPPPGWVITYITAPLQTFVSYVAVSALQPLGYPIARSGVSLTIAQYQLLVEDACAGMNSITGLVAISLFYIYMIHRASWRYALLLVALIIPVAVFVNILRVIALILLTYYYGDAVAQGFMHVTTGLVLFVFAIGAIFVIDRALQKLFGAGRTEQAA